MSTLSNGWFDLDLDAEGRLQRLTVPWMKAPNETPVRLLESYGLIFVDHNIFVTQDHIQVAIDDLLAQSPAINGLIQERSADEKVRVLNRTRTAATSHAHTIEYHAGDLQIERIVAAHPIHPVPVVTHRVTNLGRRPLDVNFYWSIGTEGGRYGVLSEKGDMVPPMMEMLGGQCALYIIKMLETQRARNSLFDWAYVDLNFGELQPHDTKSFRVPLWTVKHLWVGTQFSGYGFALSDQDPTTAIAATAATFGRCADSASWLFERLYSPMLILDGKTLGEESRDILRRAPIRLLLTNVRLDGQSLAFCAEHDVRLIYTPDIDSDPFIAVQQALDKALGYGDDQRSLRHYQLPTIVNVLPNDSDQQLLRSHYYSLRRDTAEIGDRFTVPARNVFAQASSLPDKRYAELLQSACFIRLLGSQPEIGVELERWLDQFGTTSRHSFDISDHSVAAIQTEFANRGLKFSTERVTSDGIMARLVSFFANHDYGLARMAIEGLIDPEHSPSAALSAAIEKETGRRGFWNASVELVNKHGKLEVFGPPFSVIVPTCDWGNRAIFNAALGAQYAKALRACLFPLHYLPDDKQHIVRNAFQELSAQASGIHHKRVEWHEIEDKLTLISSELMGCFDTITRVLLRAGEYSRGVRATYGQHGVYLFHSNYSLPIELVSRYEAFGRSQNLGTLTLIGRMASESPQRTALYGAENVLYQQSWYPSNSEVILASDPTGDLLGSTLEHMNVSVALCRIGITPKLLVGLNKKSAMPDGEVKSWSMPDSGPFRVVESKQDERGNVVDEQVYEFDPPNDCTIDNFVTALTRTGGVHFTGHGQVEKQSQQLVLADGNLAFEKFPRLKGHPWLVLNACDLGQAGDNTASAVALLDKGGIQVIAPLLAVKDVVASELGLLYGLLPTMSCPAAFQMSRHDMFLTGRHSTDHLAYVIYGDPFAYQGHKLWEVYEGCHCDTAGWQQTPVREKYHLCERAEHLFRIAAHEAERYADGSTKPYWRDLAEFLNERADAASGALNALIADALPSSEPRFKYLAKAGAAYLSAAHRQTESGANRSLMLAYALQSTARLQIESTALAFLDGRFTINQSHREFEAALRSLRESETAFRKTGASGDADHCVKVQKQLEPIIQSRSEKTDSRQFSAVVEALLHNAEGELAQHPPFQSELEAAQQAVASATQEKLRTPQSTHRQESLRRFFRLDLSLHSDEVVFVHEFLDSIQSLADMHHQHHSGQLAASDLQVLANLTLKLNPNHNRDRAQILINNALLKQLTQRWLYDDVGFARELPKELRGKFIGFSALFASIDATHIDANVVRDYVQTYCDLFWEIKPRIYVGLHQTEHLYLKPVDEITSRVTGLKLDGNGCLELSSAFHNLYKVRATVEEWADFYVSMLFEQQFRIPASQRFRIANTELSARFGIGTIIDIGSVALLVRGESEDSFFNELEEQLTKYLATRIDAKSLAPRIDALVSQQRGRSTEKYIALADALTRLGVEDKSFGVMQSGGIAVSVCSTKEQAQRLAERITEATGTVSQLVQRRFR
jgi:hypothetical protein